MNEHAPVALTANARHTIYTARNLSPEQKNLVAGVLRAEARTALAAAQVTEDTDTTEHIPFTGPDPDLHMRLLTTREMLLVELALGMTEDIATTLGLQLVCEDLSLVRDLRARFGVSS